MDNELSHSDAGVKPPIRVLVIDDDEAICRACEVALSREGCVVQHALGGREALSALMRIDVDVVIVDLRMERMSGLLFVEEAIKIWPWIGVVILSGHLTSETRVRANELGVEHILEKPPDFKKILESVRAAASRAQDAAVQIPRSHAVDLMHSYLQLVDRVTAQGAGTDTLINSLFEFTECVVRLLPADVAAIMADQDSEYSLLLLPQTPITTECVEDLVDEMRERFLAIGGQAVTRDNIYLQVEGGIAADGVDHLSATVSVPIMIENHMAGLLTLATVEEHEFSPADISLLYHAANHVSAVFVAMRRAQRMMALDPLTRLFNRIRLEEELEKAWLLSSRTARSMAVVVLDVDDFKVINDSFDHSVGDQVLIQLGERMRTAMRDGDILGRYGGDEFVIILPDAAESDALTFARRLLESTRNYVFCQESYRLNCTISIGVAASRSGRPALTSTELLSQADRALYTAKRAGKNRIAVWPHGDIKLRRSTTTQDEDVSVSPSEPRESQIHKGRIVVVDDEAVIRDVVCRTLEDAGYEATPFEAADPALKLIKAAPHEYDVLLTDLMMPGKTGIELIQELGTDDHSVVKVVMSGYATLDNAVSCLRQGTYDLIRKPFRREELLAMVERAVEYRRLKEANRTYQLHLEDKVRERSTQVASTLEEVKRSYEFTLEALVGMLDARERYTGRHSARVRELSVALGRAVGLDKHELQALASGALLHDIGKIGVPDSILGHTGKLSDDDWSKMREHPTIGYQIIRSSPYLRDAAEIVYAHHEKFDGTGYPRGLRGHDICLGGRIFALADAYDAMRSKRSYKGEVPPAEISVEIRGSAGTHFDPDLVSIFLRHLPELERIWQSAREPGDDD